MRRHSRLFGSTAILCLVMAFLWGCVPCALADSCTLKDAQSAAPLSCQEIASLELQESHSSALLDISSGDDDFGKTVLAVIGAIFLIALLVAAANQQEENEY